MIIKGEYKSNYHAWLAEELRKRKAKNPKYSLRAFANHLGLSPSILSEVLSARRNLSFRSADKVATQLSLTAGEREQLFRDIRLPLNPQREEATLEILEPLHFGKISKWYHSAILSLLKFEESADLSSIVRRLSVSTEEAGAAVWQLSQMGYLTAQDGFFRRTSKAAPMPPLQLLPGDIEKYHRDYLRLASISLGSQLPRLQCFQSITVAADPRRLSGAQQMIMDFQVRLRTFLEGGKPSRVYALSTQLFPMGD